MMCRQALLSAAVALLALISLVTENVQAFVPARFVAPNSRIFQLQESTSVDAEIAVDPKEIVKIFGRLAEKYIMLDSSGGNCCYSGCTGCEYRLPDGGYRMADQTSSRPKWIPVYDERKFESSGKEHTTKWSTTIFGDGPAVTKEEFVRAVVNSPYAPPLGGPYVSASSAQLDDDNTLAAALFDVLVAEGKEKLTKFRMSKSLQELANGEEGLTWAMFQKAMA